MEEIRVGVLGGGQLGRMMSIAGHNIDIEVIPLDPKGILSPAGQVSISAITGSFKDGNKINELVKKLYKPGDDNNKVKRVITVEIEHVNCDAIESIELKDVEIYPSIKTLRIIQDKYKQKKHMRESYLDIPTSDFDEIKSIEEGKIFGERYGYPYMLKACRGAYDGKGNYVVKDEKDIKNGLIFLNTKYVYAESWCNYEKEIAVMILRSREGLIKAYPVVEFTSKDSICRTTLCPANLSEEMNSRAVEIGKNVVKSLPNGAVGVFGVELFAMRNGEILYNEVAPRPHNSGHYTIEACGCSQFESHLRAVAGLSIPKDISLRVGASMMINTLGLKAKEEFMRLLDIEGASGHWYGKEELRVGRKMGHVTICSKDVKTLRNSLLTAKDILND